MRLMAVLAVLAIVGWLAAHELTATTPSSSPSATHVTSVRQAKGIAAAAQQQLQQNEARGQQVLGQAQQAVGAQRP